MNLHRHVNSPHEVFELLAQSSKGETEKCFEEPAHEAEHASATGLWARSSKSAEYQCLELVHRPGLYSCVSF